MHHSVKLQKNPLLYYIQCTWFCPIGFCPSSFVRFKTFFYPLTTNQKQLALFVNLMLRINNILLYHQPICLSSLNCADSGMFLCIYCTNRNVSIWKMKIMNVQSLTETVHKIYIASTNLATPLLSLCFSSSSQNADITFLLTWPPHI